MAEFTFPGPRMLIRDLNERPDFLFNSQFASEKKGCTPVFVLSAPVGAMGVDRFMVTDIGVEIRKPLIFGGCGIRWLVDLFLIWRRVKDVNRLKAPKIVGDVRMTTPAAPPPPPPPPFPSPAAPAASILLRGAGSGDPYQRMNVHG
ncbi:MAG: TM2 domain-containing protein [Phenylobacterium sp.]|uniref:hypothetical protein n=1 Tax=Phenylobacterium sp. TaxID=1871053 RepID=UPI0025F2EE8A|nr:hypothetical protein [Phenylobacterium sp.]MCA6234236.1 TM2 domain-containing protein [Phenylobacterium sp.]MCA6267347.1 TM2 domain-containing protein [Phenylobacterium sp.]MCA6270388.1 TM2 domain-containing protein [Phenylobacterium sp.]MCA6319625.1 TM2 domain-containing protein [Phenylobacterium sp.]